MKSFLIPFHNGIEWRFKDVKAISQRYKGLKYTNVKVQGYKISVKYKCIKKSQKGGKIEPFSFHNVE